MTTKSGEGIELPALDAVTSVGMPRRRFIQEAQREKWAKQWAKMDDEDCTRQHYKHYEWELRGAVAELEQRESQLLSALASNAELTRKGGELASTLGNLGIHVHELGLRSVGEMGKWTYRNDRAEKAEAELASHRSSESSWIDVRDMLPSVEGEYLTYSQGYDDPMRNAIDLQWFSPDGRQLIWYSIREEKFPFGISHWQPLPASPKPIEREG